jgi:hypothetical protein
LADGRPSAATVAAVSLRASLSAALTIYGVEAMPSSSSSSGRSSLEPNMKLEICDVVAEEAGNQLK